MHARSLVLTARNFGPVTFSAMAARRLIMVLLVLLFLSSLAAALIPVERASNDDSSTSTTTPPAADTDTGGQLLIKHLDAGDAKPKTIRMRLGDQLQLSVAADSPNQVEIPAFGQLEPVDLGSPATFDLLPDAAGRYPVKLVSSNRTVGRIVVVGPRRPSESGRKA
jgi:hypothetical protein